MSDVRMSGESAQTGSEQLQQLKAELSDKADKLLCSEKEVLRLTKLCTDLMNKNFQSDGEADTWSLGSAGAEADVELLREKLMKCRQNEEFLSMQLEALQSSIKIMIHPDDIESKEKGFKTEIAELSTQVEQLLAANMSMKLEISQVEELKAESDRLHKAGEVKTTLIEELHEKLAKYEERNAALFESLSEAEKSEQALRASLTRTHQSDKFEETEADTELKRVESDKEHLLQRLNSLEEKDARLRDRLHQVEEHEQTQEDQLENLKEELQLTKDINSSQEQTILDLQQQISEHNSSEERKMQEAKIAELEKKYSNMKLLLSHKMEELDFSRKSVSSLENSLAELETKTVDLESLQQELQSVKEELTLAKDINASQEETIKQLQSSADTATDLTQSYNEQLTQQLSSEDVEEMQAEYEKETNQLRKEIDQLNQQLDDMSEHHQQLLEASQVKISNAEKDMATTTSKLQIAQNLIEELKCQNKKLVQESSTDYEDKIKDLNMKLQGERVQNSVHRDVIESMSPQLEKLQCANESLEGTIKSLKEKFSVSEAELGKRKTEIESLKTLCNSLERKLEESKNVVEDLQSREPQCFELNKLKQKLESKSSESDNLAVDLLELTDKCEDLKKQLSLATEKLQISQVENDELRLSCEALKSDIEGLQEVNKTLETRLVSSQAELAHLQEKVDDLDMKYCKEVKTSESLQDLIKNRDKDLEQKELRERDSIAELQALVVIAAKDLQQVEAEKDRLVEALDAAHADAADLQAGKNQLEQELCMSNENVSKQQARISTLKDQVANLDSELNRTSTFNETMLVSLKNQIYGLTQEKSALQSRNDKLVVEVDTVLSEKQVYIDEIEKLSLELRRCRSSYEEELANSSKMTAELKERLDEAHQNLQTRPVTEENHSLDELERSQRIDSLCKANSDLQDELNSVKVKLAVISDDRDSIQKQLNEENSLGIKAKFDELSEEYNKKVESITELTKVAKQTRLENEALKLHISDEQGRNHALLKQSEVSAAELQELKQSVEEERNKSIFLGNKQADKHKSEIAALQEMMSDICSERDELKKQAFLSKASSEKASEISSLQSQIEVLQRNNEQLQINFSALQNEHVDQLSSSSAETCILQAQIDNMQEAIEKAENEIKVREKLKSLSTELQAQLRDERKAHSVTTGELQAIKIEQLTFKEQVEDLKEKHEHCQQRCEELEASTQLLEQQLNTKCTENELVASQLAKANTERQTAMKRNEDLTVELENLKLSLSEKATDYSNVLTKYETVHKQLETEEAKVKELSDLLASLQSDTESEITNSLAAHDIGALKSQLHNQKAVCNLAKRAVSLQSKPDSGSSSDEQPDEEDGYVEALQNEIAMLTSQLASTKRENDDLAANLSDLDAQLSHASSFKNEVDRLREQKSDIEASCEDMKQKLSTSSDKCNALSLELQDVYSSKAVVEEKFDSACLDITKLKDQLESSKEDLLQALRSKEEMDTQLSVLISEKDALTLELKTTSQLAMDTDRSEVATLQSEVFELQQKLKAEVKLKQDLQRDKDSVDKSLFAERQALEESETEVQKLQTSISLLMDSHETEMSSLQKALQTADSKMKELEMKVVDHSSRRNKLDSVIVQLSSELHSLKTSKEAVSHLVADLVSQNSQDSASFQQQLFDMLQSREVSRREGVSHKSTSTAHVAIENTSADIDILSIPSSPVPNPLSSSELFPLQTESLSVPSHYDDLSKSDMVAKLSDQTKHELILRKHLEEARQSLSFYRSAIDNIIDCLGTAMPNVKQWANDVLNHEDQAFNQQLDALISNESALQRRCNALEISEKALAESFKTKEQEYQLAINRLEDMVSILRASKAKLTEELKHRTSDTGIAAEQQITSLKQEVYELESNIRKLHIQNEEIRFAYEQECERRQAEEEERCRADQRSRLGTIETVKESEYLAKIASLETKISNLLNIQNELEGKLESSKHNSNEEELRQRVATVERSERALLRKIEILQQSDSQGSAQYDNSLNQPEDLLRQKIWEMERMEIHLKQQVSDLEHDREELHEIARSDKNTIHELNIQLAELTLSSKNLKAQLARVEQAEEAVCTKLDTAQVRIHDLEEKLKETLNNEKAMRLQLTDIEYSEDSLKFHTDNVERSLDTLQASEALLKSTVSDLTEEKQQALKEASAWKSRFNDLETELRTLKGQLVETKNREITLKGRVSELAATEASLRTRVKEVELQNEQFKNEVMHLKKSATGIRDSLSDSLFGKDELNNTIQDLKATNDRTKSRLAEVETEKFEMEKRLQDMNIKYTQLQAQRSGSETGNTKYNEKLTAAIANEKIARDTVVRLEAVVAAYENKQTSGVIERENFQLNAENRNLKEKLKTKERDLREVEEKVNRLTAAGNTGGGTYRINKLQEQVKDLQVQLQRSELTKASLEDMLQKVTSGSNKQGSHAHNAEMAAMKEEIRRLKAAKDAPVHRYPDSTTGRAGNNLPKRAPAPQPMQGQSLRDKCLKELVDKVNSRNASASKETEEPPAVNSSVTDDEAAEIASESSIWERLEPPVRQSPRPVMSARLKSPSPPPQPVLVPQSRSSSPAEPQDNNSDVPEESSLWEKLELVAPRKSITQPHAQVEIVFDDGSNGPVNSKSVQQVGNDSADEASELEEFTVPALEVVVPQRSPNSCAIEAGRQLSPTGLPQAGLSVDTKDVARLRQSVVDLERRLASRETEIRMLRNSQKEIERESSLSGDKYMMKTKLRSLQDQVDSGEKKIVQLREEIITRDKNLTNRQREIVDLRLELSKLREESLAKPKVEEVVSPALSPHSAQRPIQMCTAPGRQTTVEQDPALLYKSMIESKDSHVEQLTKRLEEKTSDLERLERELRSLRQEMPAAQDSRYKYLDDRYTEAATKCYKMKQERDEWKVKHDKLAEEISKHESPSTGKCPKCKQLKSEIKRLQKELRVYKDRLTNKQMQEQRLPHQLARRDDEELSNSTIDGVSSLPTDTVTGHRHRDVTSHPHTNGITSQSLPLSSSNHRSMHAKPFEAQHYETISDYNPRYFSTSGRKGQETPLKQGQIVKVLEQADLKGYARAEVNGKIYLVPMKYLQLYDPSKSSPRERTITVPQVLSTSHDPTYHIRSLTTNLPASSLPLGSPLASRRARSASPTKYSGPSTVPAGNDVNLLANVSSQGNLLRKPRAPTELRAEVVANQKLYVEWRYPQHLEQGAKSNGTPVLGFRVFLNGRSAKDIDSVYTTVTSLDLSPDQLSDLHTVSVQALGDSNVNSPLAHLSFSPATDRSPVSPRHQSRESRTVDSKKATKRLFIAYYDYDPLKHGSYRRSYASSDNRLALKTGDYIVTYGKPKSNGFYFAEVNGKTGYVPEAFIRQVPLENAKRFGFLENDAYLR